MIIIPLDLKDFFNFKVFGYLKLMSKSLAINLFGLIIIKSNNSCSQLITLKYNYYC